MNDKQPRDITHLATGATRFGFPQVDVDALNKTPDQRTLEELPKVEDDGVELDEEFNFDEAQAVDELFDLLGGRQQTTRNYAKDRRLSGKARKRARKAAKR